MTEPELLTAWRELDLRTPPFLLRGDETLLEGDRSVVLRSRAALLSHPSFDFLGDATLHLGLLPVPFAGDLSGADVFILLQNPGFRPSDYFAEFDDPDFVKALVANLGQRIPHSGFPFLFLDPRFSYHGGFDYWRRKFKGLLSLAMDHHQMTLPDALQYFSRRVAILELFPYHSSVGGLGEKLLRELRSVSLVRSYVREHLLPRAKSGDALLIVTRQAQLWGLEPTKNVVVYRGAEARSAHLSPRSRGGLAMAERFGLDVGVV